MFFRKERIGGHPTTCALSQNTHSQMRNLELGKEKFLFSENLNKLFLMINASYKFLNELRESNSSVEVQGIKISRQYHLINMYETKL